MNALCIPPSDKVFPIFVVGQVCTEGRLILEFAFDDLMRIKTWHFTIRQYRELIPRSILAMHVSGVTSSTWADCTATQIYHIELDRW